MANLIVHNNSYFDCKMSRPTVNIIIFDTLSYLATNLKTNDRQTHGQNESKTKTAKLTEC
jgi:hypothetical protein